MRNLLTRLALCAAALVLGAAPQGAAAEEPRSLLLATTTSVQDSGLLDALLPAFSEKTGIRVRAVAVGTGAALRMGAEGDADVLLTHAPDAEKKLLADGAVDRRVEIMQNYFVLAGPADDPADTRGAADVSDALRRIRASASPFVSRGDDSGTHKREVALLREAGIDPEAPFAGLSRTGSGMGLSLQIAGEKRAYILSDIGTFLAFQPRTELVVLRGEDDSLRNVYAILRVSPTRFPAVHAEEADVLIDWLLEPTTRARIAEFGVDRFGRPLFSPIAPAP